MHCPLKNDSCPEILLDYCARRQGRGEWDSVRRHVDSCAGCTDFVKQQAEVWAALDHFETPPVSTGFDAALMARIEAEHRPSWLARFSLTMRWKPALGVALVILALSFLFLRPGAEPASSHHEPASMEAALDPDQVERELDDLEMLKQLSADEALVL